jgi:hypothetical protein
MCFSSSLRLRGLLGQQLLGQRARGLLCIALPDAQQFLDLLEAGDAAQIGQQASGDRVERVDEFDTGPLALVPGQRIPTGCAAEVAGEHVDREFERLGL